MQSAKCIMEVSLRDGLNNWYGAFCGGGEPPPYNLGGYFTVGAGHDPVDQVR